MLPGRIYEDYSVCRSINAVSIGPGFCRLRCGVSYPRPGAHALGYDYRRCRPRRYRHLYIPAEKKIEHQAPNQKPFSHRSHKEHREHLLTEGRDENFSVCSRVNPVSIRPGNCRSRFFVSAAYPGPGTHALGYEHRRCRPRRHRHLYILAEKKIIDGNTLKEA